MKWIQQSKKDKRSFFYELDEFRIHLEYVRNGVTFRCHPNYKSNGEWYDWAMIRFDSANRKHCRQKKKTGLWSDHYFPSKILCFLVVPNDKSTYALVYSTKHNSHDNDSILFE